MTMEEARSIACDLLAKGSSPMTITSTTAKPYGWLFGYQSTAFVETGEARRRLVGIAPLLVLFDGRILRLSAPLFLKTLEKLDAYFAEHGNIEQPLQTLSPYLVD